MLSPFQTNGLDQKGNQPSADSVVGTGGNSDLLWSVILQASKEQMWSVETETHSV